PNCRNASAASSGDLGERQGGGRVGRLLEQVDLAGGDQCLAGLDQATKPVGGHGRGRRRAADPRIIPSAVSILASYLSAATQVSLHTPVVGALRVPLLDTCRLLAGLGLGGTFTL